MYNILIFLLTKFTTYRSFFINYIPCDVCTNKVLKSIERGIFFRYFKIIYVKPYLKTFFFNLKIKIESFFNISFYVFIDNYFCAAFFLVILKIFLSFFFIKLNLLLNFSLLSILYVICVYFNLFVYLKVYYAKVLLKLLPEYVYNKDFEEYNDTVLIKIALKNKPYKIFHYLFCILIFLRLYIQKEIVIYIILNFCFVKFLLFNNFLMITYFYIFIVMLSRLSLFMLDLNMRLLKQNLIYHEPYLAYESVTINPTLYNSYLLSFWVVRSLAMAYKNKFRMLYFTFNEFYFVSKFHLDLKVDEKYVYHIPFYYFPEIIKIEYCLKNTILKIPYTFFKVYMRVKKKEI